MKPYDDLYKDDITELQQMLFEEMTRYKFEMDFENFVSGYMCCDYRKRLDNGNARVANMSWDELLSYLEKDEPNLFKKGVVDIDRLEAGWIGRIYNLVQHKTGKTSKEVYELIPYVKMKRLFIPLHTVGEEVAVDKIAGSIISKD